MVMTCWVSEGWATSDASLTGDLDKDFLGLA